LRFRTVHDRLHSIEGEHLPRLNQQHDAIVKQVESLETERIARLESRLISIEDTAKELIECRNDMAIRQTGADALVKEFYGIKAESRLQHLELRLHECPALYWYLFDFTKLIWRIEESIDTLRQMREIYGEANEVISKPLSRRWRVLSYSPDRPPDNSVMDGENWARSLELYIQMAQGFRYHWYGDYFSGDLFTHIAQWKSADSSLTVDEFLKLLHGHHSELRKLRQDYAAAFIAGNAPRATIS
jgi:hypothetical protein